jgi:hypothetical protein
MSKEVLLLLMFAFCVGYVFNVVVAAVDRKIRTKTRKFTKKLAKFSVWQLLSYGFVGGVLATVVFGQPLFRSQPKTSHLPAQARKLTADTQAELVVKILAELTQENKDFLRQASSAEMLSTYEYLDLQQWVYNKWFAPIRRWESKDPKYDSRLVFEAVWRELRKE